MRIAVDSNVMIYAESSQDTEKRARVTHIIKGVGQQNIHLPMQACGETTRWLMRKGGLSADEAAARMADWLDNCTPLDMTEQAFREALQLMTDHSFQTWDAVIMAACSEAGVAILLSEDMQDGFNWQGVRILNPFKLSPETTFELIQSARLQ